MEERKIACITGASGFVGKHLSLRLIEENWEVHAIVRETTKQENLQELLTKGVNIHCHNKNTSLLQILKTAKPQIVFHLAAAVWTEHTYQSIDELIQSNITFGTKLLEAMAQNNCRKFINTGTYWQNYQNESYNPVNLYAATKEAFDKIIKYYNEAEKISTITLKLFDTYGPDDTRKKLMNLLKMIQQEEKELEMSKGEQLIDLVYIDDVVNAYVKAAERLLKEENIENETYAVSSGRVLPLKKVIEIYEKMQGKKLNIKWGAKPYRKREVMIPWNKGKTLSNWKAEIMLEEGCKMIQCNKLPMGGGQGYTKQYDMKVCLAA